MVRAFQRISPGRRRPGLLVVVCESVLFGRKPREADPGKNDKACGYDFIFQHEYTEMVN
ncbi:hypothetical protein D3C86_2194250 [compost metagenome]